MTRPLPLGSCAGVGGGCAPRAAGEQPALPSHRVPPGHRVHPCPGRYGAPRPAGLSWGPGCTPVPTCIPAGVAASAARVCRLRVQAGTAQLPWLLPLSPHSLTPSSPGSGFWGRVPWAGRFWTHQGPDHMLFFQQHLHHAPSSWTAATSAASITRWWWGWQSCCRSCASTASRWPSAACRYAGRSLGRPRAGSRCRPPVAELPGGQLCSPGEALRDGLSPAAVPIPAPSALAAARMLLPLFW